MTKFERKRNYSHSFSGEKYNKQGIFIGFANVNERVRKLMKSGGIDNLVNMDRFFSPGVSHLEFVTDKNLIVSPKDPHPSAEGHQQWATQLIEFIDANNLRTI